jgi:hypothetical protein
MRLGLLPLTKRPTLDESRPAPFREADVDDIEVPRDDRLREDLAGLADDLGSEVAIGEMRERQHPHAGEPRELGRALRRGMQGVVRSLLLLRREGRLVDEDVGILRCLEHLPRGTRVAREHDLPSGTRRAQDLLWPHRAASGDLDGLSALQASEERPFGDTQCARGLDIEAPGARTLRKGVTVGGHAVLYVEGDDAVIAALDRVAAAQLDQLDRIRQLPEDPAEYREEIDEARRAVDGERHFPPA